jgi:predicted dehydrogenase
VYDIDADRAGRVAEGVGTCFEADIDALLDVADAVVVAVPTAEHHAVARRALEAGCHVLVEKPLARTLEEADDLVAIAEAQGRTLAVGHIERFNPALRACIPYLEAPRFIESLRLARFQPRGTDVTVILDLMIHDIDLVLGLVGGGVRELSAVGVPVLSGSVDIANARLGFDTGAVANVTASRVSVQPKRELRIFQPSGYMSLDLARGTGVFLKRKQETGLVATSENGPEDGAEAEMPSLTDIVERIPLQADDAEPLELELAAFLDAARGDETAIVSGREARLALDMALRITREIEEFADVVAQDS